MTRYRISWAVGFLLALFLLLLMASCDPQKRINRIATKYNLNSTDTTYIDNIRIDTMYSIDKDTVTISEDLDSIFIINNIPDTCIELVKGPVTEYIYNYKTIKDTLHYTKRVKNDSLDINLDLVIWEEDNQIHFLAEIKDSKVLSKQIVVKTEKKGLFSKEVEIVLIVLIILLSLIIRYYVIKSTGSK